MESESGIIEGKRTTAVWKDYTFFHEKKIQYALCNYCQKARYKADGRYGTSNAKRHLDRCNAYLEYKAVNPHSSEFNKKEYLRLFCEANLCHSYPLRMVEHEKLRKLNEYLNPNIRSVSRNTILKYCSLEHEKLKHKLHDLFSNLQSNVCFTCDLWSACTSREFITLTSHYVDNNWNLQYKVLNFCYCPP